MAEVTTSRSGTQTLVAGILIILWLTAIFIIVILNRMNDRLEEMSSRLQAMVSATHGASPEMLRIVKVEDPANPNVVYQIERIQPEFEGMELDEFGNPVPSEGMAPVPNADNGSEAEPAPAAE